MAEATRTTRTEKAPAEVSVDASPSKDVGHDDEKAREARRRRSNDGVNTPPFEGDKEELRAHGVAQGLLDGTDPDATLIA